MGRALLVARLAARDLRRRPAEAALLLLVITAATATLTLGLVLHGVTNDPYDATRKETNGPDVVVSVPPPPPGGTTDVAALAAVADEAGVVGHSGPFPVTTVKVHTKDHTESAQAEGRDVGTAAVDQPKLTSGSWVGDGGVVVEATFAGILDVGVGDAITLNGRSFHVAGIAVTAAVGGGLVPPYASPPMSPPSADGGSAEPPEQGGLLWLTDADVRSLAAGPESLAYVLNLELADTSTAATFAERHEAATETALEEHASDTLPLQMQPWQDIQDQAGNLVRNEQRGLVTGGWLLGILAVASVAVLVGGRMADQSRRAGLLKAVGGTPRLIAAVLLAEYLVMALVAAALGLVVGWLAGPTLTDPSAELLGRGDAPSVTPAVVGIVVAAAVAVASVATIIPAVRAARTSTVRALAGAARAPRRTRWLIALSARLPVPLLLGVRIAARRPRRLALGIASSAVTVVGIVAVMAAHAQLDQDGPSSSSPFEQLRTDRLNGVLALITVMLVALAVVNAVFITWATVLDSQHAAALARALGVTPSEVVTGLATAQALSAVVGAGLGIPGGIGLFRVVSPDSAPTPPIWELAAVMPGTLLVVVLLTAIPARLGARRPVAEILQAELA